MVIAVYILNRCPTKKLHNLTPEDVVREETNIEHF